MYMYTGLTCQRKIHTLSKEFVPRRYLPFIRLPC